MNAQDLKRIADWLIDGARSVVDPPLMVAETCERLVRAGLPLWRSGIFVRTLHPDILGVNFIWKPGEAVVVVGRLRRRFYQRPGGVGSRVDVEAEMIGRARDRRRIDAALRRALAALEALG